MRRHPTAVLSLLIAMAVTMLSLAYTAVVVHHQRTLTQQSLQLNRFEQATIVQYVFSKVRTTIPEDVDWQLDEDGSFKLPARSRPPCDRTTRSMLE